jgi:two-component system OmpR family response regulator
VAEDDRKLARLVARGLRESGLVVDLVHRGDDALEAARTGGYDAVVLDVMMPGLDGFEVCRGLRAADVRSPVLLLTARTEVEDRVRGLDGGADDYMPKPFSMDELAARLRALTRRGHLDDVELRAGDLRLDPAARRAFRGGEELFLSQLELTLLETFLRHAGQVLDRDQLLQQAWPDPASVGSNVVDVYVRYLREKVDRPFGVTSIETVRGIGYRLRADGGLQR